MKATFVQAGHYIDYTPSGSAVEAGDVVVFNNLIGIAPTPIDAGTLGSLAVDGLFDVQHAADELAAGAAVYWDADGDPVGGTAGTGAATATSSGNTFMGWAVIAAGATAPKVRVKLFGSPAITVNHYGPINNAITDPGDAGAIPVTASGYVDIVTAGAETRTLAAPSFKGQQLLISFKTKVGNCVITAATTVNQTGNNTITLDTAGDAVFLIAKTNGTNIRWSVVSNDGAALSTV